VVRDNADRRRVLRFSLVRTDKVRVVLNQATDNAGVCEIWLYHETE